jgi:hypothetical protein
MLQRSSIVILDGYRNSRQKSGEPRQKALSQFGQQYLVTFNVSQRCFFVKRYICKASFRNILPTAPGELSAAIAANNSGRQIGLET